MFGQTWPQNPSRTTGLVLQCRLHQKSAPQTNSEAMWWLSGHLAFSDSRILTFGPGPENLRNQAPEGRILAPRTPGTPSFSLRGVGDFRPGLEGLVGDQFWHS